jgi:hypothetical protein
MKWLGREVGIAVLAGIDICVAWLMSWALGLDLTAMIAITAVFTVNRILWDSK